MFLKASSWKCSNYIILGLQRSGNPAGEQSRARALCLLEGPARRAPGNSTYQNRRKCCFLRVTNLDAADELEAHVARYFCAGREDSVRGAMGWESSQETGCKHIRRWTHSCNAKVYMLPLQPWIHLRICSYPASCRAGCRNECGCFPLSI